MYLLNTQIYFPPVEEADENGLLAIGGDLSLQRLLLAYRSGIFPWFNEEDPICWWSPDPRFILFPEEIYISSSMKKLLRNNEFQFTIDKDFAAVLRNCKTMYRKDQGGTWITDEMEQAYLKMHHLGFAHSAEAWHGSTLVGGLYGIRLGNIFFGESMFSQQSNASKFAFIKYVQQLQTDGVVLIDCQVYTPHLESLGAKMIDRDLFKEYLKNNL